MNGIRQHLPREQQTQREANQRAGEIRDSLEVSDVMELMSTAAGRRNVHRLLARCQCFEPPQFEGNAMRCEWDRALTYAAFRLATLAREHCHVEWQLMFEEQTELNQQ